VRLSRGKLTLLFIVFKDALIVFFWPTRRVALGEGFSAGGPAVQSFFELVLV